ncbi:MAG: hypothetical protein M0R17_07065 [Candidatus Omnitrophica bacterium]|jgi:hypothetical protein|nr:hypothetical protein [Candidatus Omnitrophota bacterium]
MAKGQWKRLIGDTDKAILVIQNKEGKIDNVPYTKKKGEKRIDIERKLKEKGYKLINVIYQ